MRRMIPPDISGGHFCALNRMITDETAPVEARRVINAKKRYIDPLIIGRGRASENSESVKKAISAFLDRSLDK